MDFVQKVNEGGERTWSKQIKLYGSVLSRQHSTDREASVVHMVLQHMVKAYCSTTSSCDGDLFHFY